ncbi:MAG TPA: zf-HC2 domain-containing protein [Pyrinomonadaceae bacterium]|jgi:hypothetical protein
MKCTRTEKFLPLYIAGDLTGRRARAVESHLTACEKCRGVAGEYRASRELLRAATLPPDFDGAFYEEIRRSVLAHIRRDHTPAPPYGFARLFNARLAYAASLALLLIVAALALNSYSRRTFQGDAPQSMHANVNGERQTTASMNTPPATMTGDNHRPAPRQVKEVAGLATRTRRAQRASKSSLPQPKANIENGQKGSLRGLQTASRMPSHSGRNPHASNVAAKARANAAELALAGGSGDATAAAAAPEVSRIEIQTSDPNIRIIWLSPATQDQARPLK